MKNAQASRRTDLVSELANAWGWTGIRPVEVVGENDFGNLIVKDETARYWRINPEDLTCEVVAMNRDELDVLSRDQDFPHGWYAVKIVEAAKAALGPLPAGRKYCFKVPPVLGGAYEPHNFAVMDLRQLIGSSGVIAQQISGLPDGSKVRLVAR
jgi:Domain of unknown function (DUF1851)